MYIRRMNLQDYSDEKLYLETERFAMSERESTTTILHHLRELERRRLYKGCPSLFVYALKELKYSDDQAYRRIAAMRLLKEIPQIEEMISNGDLTLTHVGLAQAAFRREKREGRAFAKEEKLGLLSVIAGKSTREAERIICEVVPEAARQPDVVKPARDGRNIVTMELSDETLNRLELLRGLLAHTDPSISFDGLIHRACSIAIEKLTPKASTKRGQVWQNAEAKCSKCSSQFALEVDHIIPLGKGGDDSPENLRLLCRTCNQRAAIKEYGLRKMSSHLASPETKYTA